MNDVEATFSDSIRQGDILQQEGDGESFDLETGIVVTSNCDIGFGKNRGIISYLGLITTKQYVDRFVLPVELDRCKASFEEFILRKKNSFIDKESWASISNERFLEWICEDITEEPLAASISTVWYDFDSCVSMYRSMSSQDGISLETKIELIQQLHELGLAKSRSNLFKLIHEKIVQPPSDFAFVSGGGDLSNPFGYVVNLRDLLTVEDRLIHLRQPSRGQLPMHHWKRVGRLQDHFLFHLLQKFSLVFGSIGLPRNFEESRAISAQLFVDAINGGFDE